MNYCIPADGLHAGSADSASTTNGLMGFWNSPAFSSIEWQWTAKTTMVNNHSSMIMLTENRCSASALGRVGNCIRFPWDQTVPYIAAYDLAKYGTTNNPGPLHGSELPLLRRPRPVNEIRRHPDRCQRLGQPELHVEPELLSPYEF